MTDIRNCKFAYRCTQRWADLEAVPGTMRVRFCTRCQSAVHRADTQAEFDALVAQGKCIADFASGETIIGVPNARWRNIE